MSTTPARARQDAAPPTDAHEHGEHHAAVLTALRTQALLLERQLTLAHAELDRSRRERDGAVAQLAALGDEARRLSGSVVDLTSENAELIELYVAAHRLLDAPDAADVQAAVCEIAITMIGCEEFAIYALRDGVLRAVASMGLDPALLVAERLDAPGAVARAARDGLTVYADAPLACAPLRHRGAVTGVLALHGLLPHKPALTGLDYRLIELLAAHGGRATPVPTVALSLA